jgi:lipoyl(octanoyl) transferase
LLTPNELEEKSIAFYHNNRGGDITYHGPGQMVGYPILDLEQFVPDIKRYMFLLEEVIIKTIAEYGILGDRIEGSTGVWLDVETRYERKICAFGVKTSRWITMHGWGLNVNTDLSYFNHIVPCGIANKGVTSLEKELGRKINLEEVKEKLIRNFGLVFNAQMILN